MSTFRQIAICMLALAGSFVMVVGGRAQESCYGPQEQLSAQAVTDFTSNPSQLLQQLPNGGPDLILLVRDLAAMSPATLQPILGLVSTANPTQIDAMASGLGQAASACVRTDQAFANEIQQAVAALNSKDALTLAFAAALGDKPIGAVGRRSGGGGPSSPLGGFGGSSGVSPGFGRPNHEPNFFTLSNTSATSPESGPTMTTTTTSVSPSR